MVMFSVECVRFSQMNHLMYYYVLKIERSTAFEKATILKSNLLHCRSEYGPIELTTECY